MLDILQHALFGSPIMVMIDGLITVIAWVAITALLGFRLVLTVCFTHLRCFVG